MLKNYYNQISGINSPKRQIDITSLYQLIDKTQKV